jgi:hypothetical protein
LPVEEPAIWSLMCGILVDEVEDCVEEEAEKDRLVFELLVDTRYGDGPRRMEEDRSVKIR